MPPDVCDDFFKFVKKSIYDLKMSKDGTLSLIIIVGGGGRGVIT